MATAGDVNGDGFSDVIVGAWSYDNGQMRRGASVRLPRLGGGALATTAAWTAESNQVGAYFGCSVATAGDVNGDGFADVIVGASGYDNGQTTRDEPSSTTARRRGSRRPPPGPRRANQTSACFGCTVATAGDVNGDGFSDVIVGADLYDNGQIGRGAGLRLPRLGGGALDDRRLDRGGQPG